MGEESTKTWADVTSQALAALGSQAPWVILTALAAFAIWQFQKSNDEHFTGLQRIANESREQARKDFNAANTALKETYTHVAELIDKHIAALSSSVEANDKLNERIRTQLEALTTARIETGEILAESKISLRDAKEALENRTQELAAIEASMAMLVDEASTLESEITQLREERKNINIALDIVLQNSQEINNLLADLSATASEEQQQVLARLGTLLNSSSDKIAKVASYGPIARAFVVDPADLRYGLPIRTTPRPVQGAVLEIDRLSGIDEYPLTFSGADGPPRDLKELFAELGIDLEIRWSTIPDDAAGPDGQFDDTELMSAMATHREPVNDGRWHFYVVLGEVHADGPALSSVMFDDEARRGAAVFVDSSFVQSVPEIDRGKAITFLVAHEIGHLLNLPHPWQAYGDTKSVMSYPSRWPEGERDIVDFFGFDSFQKQHVAWAPETFVKPDESRFFYYGGVTPWAVVREQVTR